MKEQISYSERQRLTITKVIFAKAKGTFDKQLMQKVLVTEIENHLRQNPDLVFLKIGEFTQQPDRSRSFPIHFTYKRHVEKEAPATPPLEPVNTGTIETP